MAITDKTKIVHYRTNGGFRLGEIVEEKRDEYYNSSFFKLISNLHPQKFENPTVLKMKDLKKIYRELIDSGDFANTGRETDDFGYGLYNKVDDCHLNGDNKDRTRTVTFCLGSKYYKDSIKSKFGDSGPEGPIYPAEITDNPSYLKC